MKSGIPIVQERELNREKIKVEIVTPVYNRRDITLQCLKSLSRIKKENLDVHIIIVDDGSTDGTEQAIRENYPEVELIKGDGNLWYTGGINRAIKAALIHNPNYVLTINDDGIFDENFLVRMIECAEKYPKSIIGSLLLLWDTPHKLFQTSPKWDVWSGGFRHWQNQTVWTIPEKPWEVEIIVGNCVLFPVEAIREAGLMNEKRYPHFGDAEYTPRMRKKGWRLLIEPKARVFCKPNNVQPRLREMPLKKLFWTLFIDKRNGNSLYRRLYGHLDAAPNRLQGYAAFVLFFARLALGRNAEGNRAYGSNEKPISETFADKIVSN
jgi:GT2 family glycosyltransferase